MAIEKIVKIKTVFEDGSSTGIENNTQLLKEFEKTTKGVQKEVNTTGGAFVNLGKGIEQVTGRTTQATQALKRVGGAIQGAGKAGVGAFRIFEKGNQIAFGSSSIGSLIAYSKAILATVFVIKLARKAVLGLGIAFIKMTNSVSRNGAFGKVSSMASEASANIHRLGTNATVMQKMYAGALKNISGLMDSFNIKQRSMANGSFNSSLKINQGLKSVEDRIRNTGVIGNKSMNLLKKGIDKTKQSAKGLTGYAKTVQFFSKVLGKVAGFVSKNVPGILNLAAGIGKIGIMAGVAFAGVALLLGGFNKLLSASIANADNIDKLAQKLGFASDSFQRWDRTLTLAGTSMEEIQGAVTRFSEAIGQAQKKTSEQSKVFDALGVSTKDVNGEFRSNAEVFEETVISLSEMENTTQRSIMATKLFGEQAKNLAPLMNAGADAIRKTLTESEKYIVVNERFKSVSVGVTDNLTDIRLAFNRAKTRGLQPFLNTYAAMVASLKKTNVAKVLAGPLALIGGLFVALSSVVGGALSSILVGFTSLEVAGEGLNLVFSKLLLTMSKLPIASKELKAFAEAYDEESIKGTTDALSRLKDQLKLTASAFTGGALFGDMLDSDNLRGEQKKITDIFGDVFDAKKGLEDSLNMLESLRTERLKSNISGRIQLISETYIKRIHMAEQNGLATTEIDKAYTREFEALSKERDKLLDEERKKRLAKDTMMLNAQLALASGSANRIVDEDQKKIALLDIAQSKEIAQFKAMLDEKKILKEDYENQIVEIELDYATRRADVATERKETEDAASAERLATVVGNVDQLASASLAIANNVFGMIQTNQSRALDKWESAEKAKIGMLNVTAKRKGQLDSTLQKEADAKRKQEFDKEKKWAIAMALINGALATIKVWSNPGFPMAIPLTILTAGLTVASVAAIGSQSFAAGGMPKNENGSLAGDPISVSVNPGERILTPTQNREYENRATPTPTAITLNNTFNGPVTEDTLNQIEEQNQNFLSQLENGIESLRDVGRLPVLA